jgi:hypothetical protein
VAIDLSCTWKCKNMTRHSVVLSLYDEQLDNVTSEQRVWCTTANLHSLHRPALRWWTRSFSFYILLILSSSSTITLYVFSILMLCCNTVKNTLILQGNRVQTFFSVKGIFFLTIVLCKPKIRYKYKIISNEFRKTDIIEHQ